MGKKKSKVNLKQTKGRGKKIKVKAEISEIHNRKSRKPRPGSLINQQN